MPHFAVKFNGKDTSWPQCVGLWAESLSLLKELNPRAWHCGIVYPLLKIFYKELCITHLH